MRAILGLTFLVLAFPAAAETLVRSCSTKPATEAFDACANSTWARPGEAVYLQVLRRNVTTNPWLKRAELVDTDRVYACMAPNIVAGAPFGAGCVDTAGAKVRLPGRSDNWLAMTELPPVSAPTGKGIQLAWKAPVQDLSGAPITEESKAIGYLIHVREDSCAILPPVPTCGNDPWTTVDVGNVLSYRLSTQTSKCVLIQAVGVSGPGGLTETKCQAPSATVELPGSPINFTVGP